jgi:hypothetical protein
VASEHNVVVQGVVDNGKAQVLKVDSDLVHAASERSAQNH